MKNRYRHILGIFFILLLCAGFAVLGRVAAGQRHLQTCEGLQVEFADDLSFVSREDVKGYIEKNYGAFNGQRLDSMNLKGIEDMLDAQSAVLKSEVFTTDDGILHARISQREPVVRFQKGSDGFYIDGRGFIFPLQDNYTSNVPIIDGDIPVFFANGYKGEAKIEREALWLQGVLSMVDYMQKSKVWAANIVQMHVDSHGDLILVPREGQEVFIFGDPHDARKKFGRIEKYYQYIQPENDYKTVNVKYAGQIICRK